MGAFAFPRIAADHLRLAAQETEAELEYLAVKNVTWTTAGTGEQIADELELWFRSGAADGFNVLVPLHPRGTEDFVEQVIPILQRRGLFREDYDGATLRDHFELDPPRPRPTLSPARRCCQDSG
ncbi:MAG TPA: hypothetical protein VIW24_07240 [Aldersonia sp.]